MALRRKKEYGYISLHHNKWRGRSKQGGIFSGNPSHEREKKSQIVDIAHVAVNTQVTKRT